MLCLCVYDVLLNDGFWCIYTLERKRLKSGLWESGSYLHNCLDERKETGDRGHVIFDFVRLLNSFVSRNLTFLGLCSFWAFPFAGTAPSFLLWVWLYCWALSSLGQFVYHIPLLRVGFKMCTTVTLLKVRDLSWNEIWLDHQLLRQFNVLNYY